MQVLLSHSWNMWFSSFLWTKLMENCEAMTSLTHSSYSYSRNVLLKKEIHDHFFLLIQVEESPFVERLLKKGYEVIYLTEPVDEYCIQSLPEFEGKKFQNVAKEGLKIDGEESEAAKERREEVEAKFEPLLKWLKDTALGEDRVSALRHLGRLFDVEFLRPGYILGLCGWTFKGIV